MANKMRSTFQKRQKELARQTRRKDKEAKRQEKAAAGAAGAAEAPAQAVGEDPDIAGIRLGPQPMQDED